MTEGSDHDEAAASPFAPGSPVDFRPDDPDHRLEGPTSPEAGEADHPGEGVVDFRPDDPGHRLAPPPDPVAAGEPAGFPAHEPPSLFGARDSSPETGASDGDGAGAGRAAIPPLWGTGPSAEFEDDPTGRSWVMVTLVLMLVFVAIAVGFTALTDSRGAGELEARLDDTDLGRAGTGASTTSAPTTTTTTVPATTAAPAATWAPFAAPDGAFEATLPTPVTEVPLAAPPGAREYRAEDGGVTYSIRSEPFAGTDPGGVEAALAEAARSVLPPGVAPRASGVESFPGGVTIYDFDARAGDTAVIGRAEVAGGRLFVLTSTVDAARADDPAVQAGLLRFRAGFAPAG